MIFRFEVKRNIRFKCERRKNLSIELKMICCSYNMKELNAENIKIYLENNEKQFLIFDIPYTKKEKKCIDNFDLKIWSTYDNYGDNDLSDLNDFLIKLGSNSQKRTKRMCDIIKKITKLVISGYQDYCPTAGESYWLTIRVTQSTNEWDIPRWHCDGNYFFKTGERELVSKFATALHGPGTLLIKTTDSQRRNFIDATEEAYRINEDGMSKNHRRFMDNNMLGDMIKPTNYQSVIFISGPREICGIHSEPEIHGPRMFLSIVPGSKKEIIDWHNKRGGGNHSVNDSKDENHSDNNNYVLNKNKYLALKNRD